MRGLALLALVLPLAAQEEVVFRGGTTLVRVDVQALDRNGKPIPGLTPESFVLKETGQSQPIRNFASEEMPLDLLFLVDVSGSMRPHVERIAEAASFALPGLRPVDRTGVMVFDRKTRLRMPLKERSVRAVNEFERVLDSENFRGGTDITRALLDAAKYMRQSGRPDARRAIVLLTDDQTESEFFVDPDRVGAALQRSRTILSALLVPNMVRRLNSPVRRRGRIFGGVIVIGPRTGPIRMNTTPTEAAHSDWIARNSGGDVLPATQPDALATSLDRLRQRYALHFSLPPGVKEGEERELDIALEPTVLARYPGAKLDYRQTYVAAESSEPGEVTFTKLESEETVDAPSAEPETVRAKRRKAVDGSPAKGPSLVIH